MGKGILAKMVRDFTPCFHDKYEWKDFEEKFWEAKKEYLELVGKDKWGLELGYKRQEWFKKWFGLEGDE